MVEDSGTIAEFYLTVMSGTSTTMKIRCEVACFFLERKKEKDMAIFILSKFCNLISSDCVCIPWHDLLITYLPLTCYRLL